MNLRRHLAFATATAPATTGSDAGSTRAGASSRVRTRALPRPRPELLGLMLLTAVLNLWALSENGWANQYYSATVRSMTSSWHNFLYGSFDVAGVMTVDKPPLALWVQAASAKLFGFSSLSMLVPQALMGIAAVALVYDLTRRVFGRPAGFVAGLALATTPITVAISRHNNPDALLVLCCVAALWFVVRGLQDGRTRWIVLAGVATGLGFETKMAAALIVAPAIYAAWLWVAPRGRIVALRQTLASGAALVAVGAAWPLLIALTPAGSRPWVSGTSDNSIWSLIVGYNGVGRLSGQAGGPGGMAGGGGGGGGGGAFGGPAGVLRLFDYSLGAQAGWLIGFALVGGIGILAATRLRRSDARTGWLIASGGAFVGCAAAFSSAEGIFHPYYVSQLAPFTAVLVGGSVGFMLGRDNLGRVLAPFAVALGAAGELLVLHNTEGSASWAPALVVIAAVGTVVVLAASQAGRIRMIALAVALAALFAAPTAWAAQTIGHATNGTFPAGGPASSGGLGGPGGGGPGDGRANGRFGVRPNGGQAGGPPGTAGGQLPQGMTPPGANGATTGRSAGGPFGRGSESLNAVLAYVKSHGGGTIGVSSQTTASGAIIDSGAAVAGLGGFSGRESEVSVAWLADAVEAGRVRWVLADSGGMGNDGRTGSSTVMAAVAETCKAVTVSSSATSATLYDCQGNSAALRALS